MGGAALRPLEKMLGGKRTLPGTEHSGGLGLGELTGERNFPPQQRRTPYEKVYKALRTEPHQKENSDKKRTVQF